MNREKISKFLCSETEKGERENNERDKTCPRKARTGQKYEKRMKETTRAELENKGQRQKEKTEISMKQLDMQSKNTVEFIHQK